MMESTVLTAGDTDLNWDTPSRDNKSRKAEVGVQDVETRRAPKPSGWVTGSFPLMVFERAEITSAIFQYSVLWPS